MGVVVALQLATVAEGEIEPTQIDVGKLLNVTVGLDFTVMVLVAAVDTHPPGLVTTNLIVYVPGFTKENSGFSEVLLPDT